MLHIRTLLFVVAAFAAILAGMTQFRGPFQDGNPALSLLLILAGAIGLAAILTSLVVQRKS